MKCLVTGGAGFIGSHLVERLLAQGAEVCVFDNLSSGRPENLDGLGALIVEGDVRDAAGVRSAVRGMDAVFHLAALCSVARSIEDPVGTHAVNTTGTVAVLDACRQAGVRRVVFASSSSIYGDSPELPKREDMLPAPLSPYAASKMAGEHWCRMYRQAYGLETVCLRFFNVFGPRQDPASDYAAVIPRFIRAALRGERPILYGDGSQTRDFIYAADVARALHLAATAPGAAGAVLNIAGGERRSLRDLLAALEGILGRSLSPEVRAARPGDVQHSVASTAEAQRVLGYAPSVSFADGLERTVDWYDRAAPAPAPLLRPLLTDRSRLLPS